MLGTRHEEYKAFHNKLPFVLHESLKRTPYNCSKEQNWHENLEIQFCLMGYGTVLLDGTQYTFQKGDIVVVNPNVIHYTGTDDELTYSCLIISPKFCAQMGFDSSSLLFSPLVKDTNLVGIFRELMSVYSNRNTTYRTAKLNKLLITLLIELSEHHSSSASALAQNNRVFETVKAAVKYIRENYASKITLDEIAKAVLIDKFSLCREFKRITGQTVIENINRYRCIIASELLSNGSSVTETASLCGFENPSFFTKTFKKYTGLLPSDFKGYR